MAGKPSAVPTLDQLAFRPRRQRALVDEQPSPATPRTPLGRSYSSTYSSPGVVGLRPDEDTFVFEIDTRFFRGGIAGQNAPRCKLDYSPNKRNKLADYSQWLPGGPEPASQGDATMLYKNWGNDHVLWQLDVRHVDMGLLSDILERTVREAIVNDILVLDGKRRKLVLALPPALPDPILETMLLTLFNTHPPPTTITLLPVPVLCTVAAGLRSALVVDIGWDETSVSANYEYRQVRSASTSRGMKRLTWSMRKMLLGELAKAYQKELLADYNTTLSFEEVEEVTSRLAWCGRSKDNDRYQDDVIEISLASNLELKFCRFSEPVEETFLNSIDASSRDDDNEKPVPLLMFETLLALPMDIRQVCLSRIIITGQGGSIPGLKGRLLAELSALIRSRTWDAVHDYGSVGLDRRNYIVPTNLQDMQSSWHRGLALRQIPQSKPRTESEAMEADSLTAEHVESNLLDAGPPINKDLDPSSITPAHRQPPIFDKPIYNSLRSRTLPPLAAFHEPPITAVPSHERVRGVATAGAWAGASLLAGLRVPGAVEIERERFMKGGLVGWEAHMREEQEREMDREEDIRREKELPKQRRTFSGLSRRS
jgi:hypothetical protein